jgi:hypothetical protein
MTLSAAIGLGTSTIASFIAPSLYTQIGIEGIALVAAFCSAIALSLLLTRVREGPEAQHNPAA